jgi:hypothetical protein
MNKRLLVSLVSTLILASGYTSEAQQPKKVPRIGYLDGASLPLRDPHRGI